MLGLLILSVKHDILRDLSRRGASEKRHRKSS